MVEEYNPLDEANLVEDCVRELMGRTLVPLTDLARFEGAGVYMLFFDGEFPPYRRVRSASGTSPIYIGSAMPPGGRKGMTPWQLNETSRRSKALYGRLRQHAKSIEAASDIDVSEFSCRYLVMKPVWIIWAERLLLARYTPLWNTFLDGFGNHRPGLHREGGRIPWWDALHAGRRWAIGMPQTRTRAEAVARIGEYFDALQGGRDELAGLAEQVRERED